MASIGNTARRIAFALAVVAATIAAPAAIFFSPPDGAAPRVIAEPGDCSESAMPGDDSLNCSPGDVPVMGAPSEMDLTDTNTGFSPMHGNHR